MISKNIAEAVLLQQRVQVVAGKRAFVRSEASYLLLERRLLFTIAGSPGVFADPEHATWLENTKAILERPVLIDDVVQGVMEEHGVERLGLEIELLDGRLEFRKVVGKVPDRGFWFADHTRKD